MSLFQSPGGFVLKQLVCPVCMDYDGYDMSAYIILESVLTCPACGHAEQEVMPTDACLWFYECKACAVLLRPLAGDCCVFCSYGTVKCPPVQTGGGDCCSG